MDTAFSYSTTYILDKAHFSECFTESATVNNSVGAYLKALALFVLGTLVLRFTEISAFVGGFAVILGMLEVLSIKYQKAWWIARQTLSRAANGKVNLTIDEQAIKSHSIYVQSVILWADVSAIKKTSLGWLVMHNNGKNYLSSKCLSSEAQAFIAKKSHALQNNR